MRLKEFREYYDSTQKESNCEGKGGWHLGKREAGRQKEGDKGIKVYQISVISGSFQGLMATLLAQDLPFHKASRKSVG